MSTVGTAGEICTAAILSRDDLTAVFAAETTDLSLTLASALEKVRVGRDQLAFRTRYSYGDTLWRGASCVSPCAAAGRRPCVACAAMEAAFTNGPVPLALVTDGSIEIATKIGTAERYAPLRILTAGDYFGVFETLDRYTETKAMVGPPWEIVAGSHSIQIIAPLEDTNLSKAITRDLKEERVPLNDTELPFDDPTQHWKIIQKLSAYKEKNAAKRHYRYVSPTCEVIWLGHELMRSVLRENPDAALHLFEIAWEQTAYSRSAVHEELSHHRQFLLRKDSHLQNAPFLFKSLRHVMAMASSRVPAIAPLTPRATAPGDEGLLAIQEYLSAQINTHAKTKKYPHMVRPVHMDQRNPVAYYSMRYCPLPSLLLSDEKSLSNPIWRERVEEFMALADGFGLTESISPVGRIHGPKKEDGTRSKYLDFERSWQLVDNDFGFISGASPNKQVYREATFLSACIRVALPEH